MVDTVVEALILDLLDWVAMRERTYEEVMSVWRTSCPKLPVWEDANERGLIETEAGIVSVNHGSSGPRAPGTARSLEMKITILDDYHDTLRTLAQFQEARRARWSQSGMTMCKTSISWPIASKIPKH